MTVQSVQVRKMSENARDLGDVICTRDFLLRLTIYIHFDDDIISLDPELAKIRCIGFRSKIYEHAQV